MSYKEAAISTVGVSVEKEYALRDVSATIIERGPVVKINLFKEGSITRDRLNSIKKRGPGNSLSISAYPITYNPTTKRLSELGIREKVEVVIYTSMHDWNKNGYDMARLNEIDSIRGTVIISGTKYEIKEKSLFSEFSDTFLYVVLGLNKI